MFSLTKNSDDKNSAQTQTLHWQVAKAAGGQMVCGPQGALRLGISQYLGSEFRQL